VSERKIPKSTFLSHTKTWKYIAVNCGAIPEGTVDSELFWEETYRTTEPVKKVEVGSSRNHFLDGG
jgi:transcriptional regulator of aromatic amino acid metabolism